MVYMGGSAACAGALVVIGYRVELTPTAIVSIWSPLFSSCRAEPLAAVTLNRHIESIWAVIWNIFPKIRLTIGYVIVSTAKWEGYKYGIIMLEHKLWP